MPPPADPARLRVTLSLSTAVVFFSAVLLLAALGATVPFAIGLVRGRPLLELLQAQSTPLLVAGGALVLGAWQAAGAQALLGVTQDQPGAEDEARAILRRAFLLLAALLALGAGTTLRHLLAG
jgi:hypothetical protein